MITWNQIMFLIKGTHKDFIMVEKNATGLPSRDRITTGDLLMRKMKNVKFYHVGIYDRGLVVEYTAPENKTTSLITSSSSPSESGIVNKKSVKTFIAKSSYRVLRLRMGIPENFSDLVDASMDYDGIYHILTNNCLHFALRLLQLNQVPLPRSLPQQRGEEISMDDLEHSALTQ